MKKYFLLTLPALLLFLYMMPAEAQVKTPRPSPKATFTQDLGLGNVEVTYYRPSVKGRTIFGDLVPYGKMWRTGANGSTTLTFSEDVTVGGHEVPKGTYALYSIPNEKEWTLILYTKSDCWGICEDYDESMEQARWTAKVESVPMLIETMTVDIGDITNSSAIITLLWENTMVSFDVKTNTDKQIIESIDKAMAGTSMSDYYNAAVYYLDTDRDMDKALTWINKALEQTEKFWMVRRKALILAKMKNYKEAIKAAERSMELAKEAENDDYVRMNEKSIAEWKKM